MINKKEILKENITVVVRSVGERTEKVCMKLLNEDLPKENILLVKNISPFDKAHKISVEKGIDAGRKYTIIIDADVLVAKNSIWNIYKYFESQPSKAFEVHTLELDKYFGGPRYGGIKMYRTEHLKKAVEFIPSTGESARPETEMILKMYRSGYYWVLKNQTTSMHDFYQAYEDILRKGYTHASKHSHENNNYVKILLPYWQRMSETDADFKILLEGYNLFKNNPKQVRLDVNETPRKISSLLQKLGIKEKNTLDLDSFTQETVKSFIENYELPEEYLQVQKQLFADLPKDTRPLLYKLKDRLIRFS